MDEEVDRRLSLLAIEGALRVESEKKDKEEGKSRCLEDLPYIL